MERLKKIYELRSCLNDLREHGATLKKSFSAFEKVINSGKFVSAVQMTEVSEDFVGWMNGATKCFELYEELFDKQTPETFSALEKILDAEEKKIIVETVFKRAEQFLFLVAERPKLRRSLNSYKKKLTTRLAKKNRDKKAMAAVEPYAKFMDAFNEKNIGKKFSASNELRRFFNDDFLGTGLFGEGVLTLSEQKVSFPTDMPTFDELPVEEESDVDLAEIIREKDALLTADDFAPWEKIFTIKRGNQREITAKRLKKDFGDSFLKAEKSHVLVQAVFDEYFSIQTLCEQIDFSLTDLENATEFLLNKGYLQKYTLGDESFYGITKEFYDFLKADNGKEFFKNFLKNHKKSVNLVILQKDYFSITAAKFALPRAFFIKFHAMENKRKDCACGVNFFPQSIQGRFICANEVDLVLSCLWDNTDEYEDFFNGLKKILANTEYFNRVIVAGLNVQHAEKIFDALEKALGRKFPKAVPYVYALDENAFYHKGSPDKMLPEEIWSNKFNNDPEDTLPVVKRGRKSVKTSAAKTFATKTSTTKTPDTKTSDTKTSVAKTPDAKTSDAKTSDTKTSDTKTSDAKVPLVKNPVKKVPLVKTSVKKNSVAKSTNVQPPAEDLPPATPLDEMLAAKKFYCATAYLKALSLHDEAFAPTYRQLAFAVNDPMLSINYDANKIISLFNDSATPDEIFLTAATLRTFFYSHNQFDYDMKILQGIVKNFSLVERNSPLADLIFELMNFKDKARNGADFYADYRVKNRQQAETQIAVLRREAQTCLDRIKNFNDNAFNPRFIETKKILFGDDSELAKYLEYTAEDLIDEEILTNIKLYLIEKFMREDAPLSVENIDNFKMDEIIDEAWEIAGKNIRRKKHTMLVGELKNNVITSFKKAIEILCERIKIFEEVSPLHSDAGAAEYRKIRGKLIERARSAKKILSQEKNAAVAVLTATLQEIIDKLEGTFEPIRQKYFYMEFLRGAEILLDENYYPILNFNTLDGTGNSVADRIIVHARANLPTFEERIRTIFEDSGWDFGSAQLIDAYLEERDGKSFIEQSKYKLQDSISAASRIAANERKNFFGFLELAQSYGQFDAAPENTKEKILKLIDRCFEFANKSDNFGVFFRVKTFWENQTQEDAAKYATLVEAALERGIKNYRDKNNDTPALQDSIAQIRKMIDRRNYTVAQGLINRLSDGKLCAGTETSTEQTHLQRFIEDYESYYGRVRKSGESFKTLVGKNHRFRADTSKGIKGGEILIDSWIPNGFPQNGDVGEDKIERLLNALGFKVESVKRSGAIKKDALNYKIKLLKPSNGRASNYNHPISAFGSKAEINGFRVTCLFGMYSADGLIARFKELGNAENTLVLLDYALELPTRRALARRIKSESGITKVFAVVDRVIMMYLVKNYDELQINKILMSLMMPFAACQPYVFNPNVPIPPEIFIGREKEMRRVLDFDDANLVYGGRQLGKTALLKMACASLDRNENNDRAIFVDVNKCNCAAAALKICRKLHEENFFNENFSDVSDWGELAAAIKKRLASDTPNKIPRFMLALDEADDFIKSCREEDFKPILELIDIQQNFHNGSRFKFVMAGLRDVVRFYRDDLLGNNNQIAKLPSLTVKPFELEDASKLLKEPLRCLGLYFSDNENSDSLAMMILETTNYFPGLIQLYCAKLIEALSKEDYASYDETKSPIYEVSESHVQSILGEESFNEEIKNKVNMTLRLGDDKFYYVIAHLMAWRYHNDDSVEGYSAEDISDTAAGFGLENLLPQDVKQIEALLKEMCELNILRETDKGKYLFVRQRFLNMIGTSEEIEAEITAGFSEN